MGDFRGAVLVSGFRGDCRGAVLGGDFVGGGFDERFW